MSSDFHTDLEDVLKLNGAAIRAHKKALWLRLLSESDGRFLVFGAADLGLYLLRGLWHEGLRPFALIDNNASDFPSVFDGIPLLTPAQAAENFGTEHLCVLSIHNTSRPREQLTSLGFSQTLHFAEVFSAFPNRFLPFVCLDDSNVIEIESDKIRAAFGALSNEDSRQTFVAQLRYRMFLDFDYVRFPQSLEMRESEYFPSDLYSYLDDEVLVDCGAFKGDTIDRFIRKRGENFSAIYAFEPDRSNFSDLKNKVDLMPVSVKQKFRLFECGIGGENKTAAFFSDDSVRSRVSEHGDEVISVYRLDDMCRDIAPSLIKMDIEGAEVDALYGAREVIQRARPVLAVCVYHASAHLWQIPLLIKDICPDYHVYLLAHAEDCWDVTCYAVPPERSVAF